LGGTPPNQPARAPDPGQPTADGPAAPFTAGPTDPPRAPAGSADPFSGFGFPAPAAGHPEPPQALVPPDGPGAAGPGRILRDDPSLGGDGGGSAAGLPPGEDGGSGPSGGGGLAPPDDGGSGGFSLLDSGGTVVTITATDPTATEADEGIGQFTVTRTGDLTSPLTVYYETGGTASPYIDYRAMPGAITIGAGSSTAVITLDPLDDDLPEADESVLVTLAAHPTYSVGEPSAATVTLADDDDDGNPDNQPPDALDDTAATTEDLPVTFAVLPNDLDPDGDPLTVVEVVSGSFGSVVINPDNTLTYTPNPDQFGTDVIGYTVSDGRGGLDSALVEITVNPVNDAPVAVDDVYGVHADTPVTVLAPGLLLNDLDADHDTLTVHLAPGGGPAHGTLTLNPDGSFTYTPEPGNLDPQSFSYYVSDGLISSAPATVSLTIHEGNSAPIAIEGAYSIGLNQPLHVGAPGLLLDDTDPDGDPLTASLFAGPEHGELDLAPDGSFSYLPDPDFVGEDSFAYRPCDGLAYGVAVIVTIVVTNDEPVATPDAYGVHFGTTLTMDGPGVLSNDWDPERSPLTAVLVTGPGYDPLPGAELQLNPDGSFTYTPPPGFVGEDSFFYQAYDGFASSAVTQVSIAVTDSAPSTLPDAFYIATTGSLGHADTDVLRNDVDVDDDALTVVLVEGPQQAAPGSFALNANGTFSYAPVENFTGTTDQFTYQAFDGALSSEPTVVTITVTDNPVAFSDGYLVDETQIDGNYSIDIPAAQGVLSNDRDPLNEPLRAEIVSWPQYGTLTVVTDAEGTFDGSFSYTPFAGFPGTDTFTYRAKHGSRVSDGGTVTIASHAAGVTLNVKLTSVTFSGRLHEVEQDNVRGYYRGTPPAGIAHWLDVNGNGVIETAMGDHAHPTAITRNTSLLVTARFAVQPTAYALLKPAADAGRLTIRGRSPGNFNFQVQNTPQQPQLIAFRGANPETNPSTMEITAAVPTNNAFDKATHFDPLEIIWSVVIEGNPTVFDVGTSKNSVYVTLNDPRGVKLFHTVVHLGSTSLGTLSAADQGNRTKAIDAIWSAFSTRNVKNFAGWNLYYYYNWVNPNNTTANLLTTRDGQCDGWSNLFLDVLRAQGLALLPNGQRDVRLAGIFPAPAGVNTATGFLVKKWQFPNNPEIVKYSYTNVADLAMPIKRIKVKNDRGQAVVVYRGYNWRGKPQVADEPGVEGQNTKDPRSEFTNHVLVVVESEKKVFDPSYGGDPYTFQMNLNEAVKKIDDTAIAGYYQLDAKRAPGVYAIRANSDTVIDLILRYIDRNN
jgi:hypothetical protein